MPKTKKPTCYGVNLLEEIKRSNEMRVLEEYPTYYVFGKYDNNGKLLYKESFLKIDVLPLGSGEMFFYSQKGLVKKSTSELKSLFRPNGRKKKDDYKRYFSR